MDNKLCLVTGGAGFIGSHLVEALLSDGYKVRVFDNLSSGNDDNLKSVKDKIEFIQGCITDINQLQKAMEGVNKVFHYAALVSVPVSMLNPTETEHINGFGTMNVMHSAAKAGVAKLVNISSAAVYGDSPRLPKHEDMKPNPLSPYAQTKLNTEYIGKMFTRSFNLNVVTLRYFNVYGPRQRPDSDYAAVVPKFITLMKDGKSPTVFGDGNQTRDFVYVKDAARAAISASEQAGVAGKVINVACGKVNTILDLINIINDQLKTNLKPIFAPERIGDIKHSSANNTLAKKWLRFEPEYNLEKGIAETIKFSL